MVKYVAEEVEEYMDYDHYGGYWYYELVDFDDELIKIFFDYVKSRTKKDDKSLEVIDIHVIDDTEKEFMKIAKRDAESYTKEIFISELKSYIKNLEETLSEMKAYLEAAQ